MNKGNICCRNHFLISKHSKPLGWSQRIDAVLENPMALAKVITTNKPVEENLI